MIEPIRTETQSEIQTQKKYLNPERRWVLGFALLTMLVTTLPYLLGYWSQGANWQFSGFVFGVEDGNNYIAKMLRGATGDWLFRTPYSAYPQQGVIAYSFHLLLGKLTSSPKQHEKLVALYHLTRIIGGIFMILVTYDFIAMFVKRISLRRWGVVLASWGGGLGWVLIILGYNEWLGTLPLEFYSPESFGFIMLYGIPHLVIARALFLGGLICFLRCEPPTKGLYNRLVDAGIVTGFLWLLMGFLQPLTVVLAWTIAGLDTAVKSLFGKAHQNLRHRLISKEVKKLTAAVLISSPIVIYTVMGFNADEFHRTWTAQIITLAPHPWHYVLAYGLLLPFVIAGIVKIIKTRYLTAGFLAAWVFVLPILLSIPIGMQRRLVEGFWVAVIVLTLIWFDHLQESLVKKLKYVFLFTFPSTLLLFTSGFLFAASPGVPLFRPFEEIVAFNYLAENTDSETAVLSSYETGNAMPAWASVFVVIGHGPETVHLSEIKPRVLAFYQSDISDSQRQELLAEFGVDYVFWGPSERELGDWEPSSAEYLSLVYQGGGYEIFEVISDAQ